MGDFQPKLDQLAIITSRGNDPLLLTRALIIIHNDLITYMARAAKEYCSNNLMESLINLTRSAHNHLVIILSTSLLHSICTCGDFYVSIFFKLNGPIHLLSMISARDNTGDTNLINHTLLIHEQAMKLLVLLTTDIKYHQLLVNMGFLERLPEICEVFKQEGYHKNCCFDKFTFNDEARSVARGLIEGKKLVGKIDEDESGGKGSLNVYAVELYDTTTVDDININTELLKLGYAWPEPLALPSESAIKPTSYDTVWCDFHITKVVDAHCFWAFIDGNAPRRIMALSHLLESYVYSSDVCPVVDANCGDRVCVSLTKEKSPYQWMRACVLEVDESSKKCHVLLVDYGYGAKVDCDQIFPLPNSVKDMPHQANLCVLKGVRPAPSHPVILRYISETIANMTQENRRFRTQMHSIGVTKSLLRFCLLPHKDIVRSAVAALSNILNNFNVRTEIGQLGACKIVNDLLRQYEEDNGMLDGLLSIVLNLIIECYQNRKIFVEFDFLLVLMKLYRSSVVNITNKELVIKILKNLVGNGWRLLDPVNVPDVRGIIQETVDSMKGSFNLPNLCGDEILEEVKRRRSRRPLKPCQVEPTPTYVSLTADDLVKKKMLAESDEDSRSEGYKTGPETDFEDNYESESITINKDYDGYMYGARSCVAEDERHSFMYGLTFKEIKSIDIGNTVCALLNNGTGGTIYIGITKSGQVLGMNISRRERDNLRLGVDDVLGRFVPTVKHDKYEIKCIPVMKGMSVESLTQVEERYVIEIRVAKSSYKYFQTPAKKLFFREFVNNVELNIQQIRERTIMEEEGRYQSEIEALRLALEETRIRLKVKNTKLDLD